MRAVIVASGPDVDREQLRDLIRDDDLLVVADGGLNVAIALDLRPARVFGDFDSASPCDLAEAERRGWQLTRVPRKKNETDTELAVGWALDQGATELVLAGVTGGRLDHTLANIMMLVGLARAGVPATIIDGRHEVRAVTGGELDLDGSPGVYLSLVPVTSEVTGVTIVGAKYGLRDATLQIGKTLAVSNEFVGKSVRVSTKTGALLVITAREPEPSA